MKITQLDVDHRDEFDGEEIATLIEKVGGKKCVYPYDQDNVDAKVMVFSSHPLTQKQLDILWEEGDLYTGDKTWTGDTFEDIVKQILKHIVLFKDWKPSVPS